MSDNMDLISKENISDCRKNENTIIDDLQNSYIFKLLNEYEYNNSKLSVIFESELYSSSNRNELNMVFRKMKKNNNVSLSDIVMYLERFTEIRKIINFFDAETKWLLKEEMSDKCNIKMESNLLYEIME